MTSAAAPRPSGYLTLLRQREFGVLWVADLQSLLGDQLARVALAVLVYERTGSSFATAGVYALTFAPALVGSLVLGPLADRIAPRTLLTAGDLLRAGLLAIMALPGVPVWTLAVLLVIAVLVGAPWKAAERALIVEVLAAEDYVTGTGFRTATTQGTQLLGFAVGGVAVAAIGPRWALALDAATFVISAALIRFGLRARTSLPSYVGAHRQRARWLEGTRTVWRDRRLRTLVAISALLGVLVIPEGLAAPYADQLGAGTRTVGVLLAAMPAGSLVGSLVFARWVPAPTRAALVTPLILVSGLPLIVCASAPGVALSVALWAVTGVCSAYQVQIAAEFVRVLPPDVRGQGISTASGVLLGVQGLGLLVGGALATRWAPATVVAFAGVAATVAGAALAAQRRRVGAVTGAEDAPSGPAALPGPDPSPPG